MASPQQMGLMQPSGVLFWCLFILAAGVGLTAGQQGSPPVACPCASCPAGALDQCDIYFQGFSGTPALFTLNASAADQAFDLPVIDSKTNALVGVSSTANATFYCARDANCTAGGQFFVSDVNGRSVLVSRALSGALLPFFQSRCLILPIRTATITLGTNNVTNLSPGDNNAAWPEPRRCLVVTTGPQPPSTNCCSGAPPPTPAVVVTPPIAPAPAPAVVVVPPVTTAPSPAPAFFPPPPPPPAPVPVYGGPLGGIPPVPPAPGPGIQAPPVVCNLPPGYGCPYASGAPAPAPAPGGAVIPLPTNPPPPPCGTTCYLDPLAICDFYFEGFNTTVPNFNLSGPNGDRIISPRLKAYSSNVSEYIQVAGTNLPGQFRGCPTPPGDANNQFYATGDPAQLWVRTFQVAPGRNYYVNRCILLPLTQLSVSVAGTRVNLRPGDNNTMFPEQRRCIFFMTGIVSL